MGPRFFKRGDRNRLSRLFMVVIASMGPRFFKRGDQSGDVAIGQNDFASMGPRFFKRGDTLINAECDDGTNGFNGATLL